MFLNEAEIRKVIRRRLIMEKAKEYEQSGGEIAGDIAKAGAAGAAATGVATVGAAATSAGGGDRKGGGAGKLGLGFRPCCFCVLLARQQCGCCCWLCARQRWTCKVAKQVR